MRNVKLIALIFSLALFTHLKAEVVRNSFAPGFGPTYAETAPAEKDGWKYRLLQSETAPASIYYGNASISLQTFYSSNTLGYLISPEKQGGVGWVTFWYKSHNTSTYYTIDYKMEVSVSADGENFTPVDTVTTPIRDNATWFCYSRTINNLTAKYVRLQPLRSPDGSPYTEQTSPFIDIDEILITDAVAGGTPASVRITTQAIEGEVGKTASLTNKVLVSRFGDAGNVKVTLNGTGVFALASDTVTLTNVGSAGVALPISFSPPAEDAATGFVEIKNFYSDFFKVSGTGLPDDVIFKFSGTGLERSITEGFNIEHPTYTYGTDNTFYYRGWRVERGSYVSLRNYPSYVAEGAGAIHFYASLTSPKLAAGIGTVSFKYKAEGSYDLEFDVLTSADNQTWNKVDHVTATSNYATYTKVINTNDSYVKIVPVDGSFSKVLDVDAFVISEKNKSVPTATVQNQTTLETLAVPYEFTIPITFAQITDNVAFSFSDPQLTPAVTTITKEQANGVYNLKVTYNPAGNKKFVQSELTISGGGLPFALKSTVTIYLLADLISTGFDGAWEGSYNGTVITDEGWTLTAVTRSTTASTTAFGSPASVQANSNSKVISPPKSGGVGSIQFYSRNVYSSTPTITLSVSEDGTNWTTGGSVSVTTDAYQPFEITVNNPNAKYVKWEATDYYYIDNVIITKNGTAVSKLTAGNIPVYMANKGEQDIRNIELEGTNISSPLHVSFKSGAAFSSSVVTIAAKDISGKSYELPVKFLPEKGSYILDTLIISGADLAFDQIIPLKGYALQDMIYQDFNGLWIGGTTYDLFNVDGWDVVHGSREIGSNVYEGPQSLSLSAGTYSSYNEATLLSVPKSGGVGSISFYCKASDPGTLQIRTYESLGGAPKVVCDTFIGENSYKKIEILVDDENAKYVEFAVPKLPSGYVTIYLDVIAVTAKGKSVPSAFAPQSVALSAYAEETDTRTFKLTASGVDKVIHLSLSQNDAFTVSPTTIVPAADGTVDATIEVAYTPVSEPFSMATLSIESDGFLQTLSVSVRGNIPQAKYVEDFNSVWAIDNTMGDYVIDGWTLKNGARITYPIYEAAACRIRSQVGGVLGSLTSPAKAGGVNNVQFYYHSETLKFYLQTSPDGDQWKNNDSVIVTANTSSYILYSKEIKDRDAKYFRIQTEPTQTFSYWDLRIDSIVIDAMPYLRKIGADREISTTSTSLHIPVRLVGLLNSNATIKLKDGSAFQLTSTTLTAASVANDAVATIDLIFNGGSAPAFGIYNEQIVISNPDLPEDLIIPVSVNYTKPSLALVNTVDATLSTSAVPFVIPVQIAGILNTDALIVQDDNVHYTLSADKITPNDVANGAKLTINVTFSADTKGTYPNEIRITNGDITPIIIPFTVILRGTGIDLVPSDDLLVYLSKDGSLNIVGAPAGTNFTIYNLQGQSVYTSQIKSTRESLNLGLPRGIYMVKVKEKVWKINK